MPDDPNQPPVLPPSNPVMPNLPQQTPAMPQYTGDPIAQILQSMQGAMQTGTQAFQGDEAQKAQLAAQLQKARGEQQAIPLPKTGITDEPWMKMQPVMGQGAGGDIGNLAKDIGRAILMGLGSTGPGQNIQKGIYGPGERAYKGQMGAKAAEIESLQNQMKSTVEGEGAASNLASRSGTAYGSVERAQAGMLSATSKAAYDKAKINLDAKAQDLQAKIAAGKLTAEQARTQMMGEIAKSRNATMSSIASLVTNKDQAIADQRTLEDQYKTEEENYMQRFLGIGATKPAVKSKPSAGGGKPTHVFVPGKGLQPAQ